MALDEKGSAALGILRCKTCPGRRETIRFSEG
ncbi:hypothetical protein CYA_2074 [Synechococcus sp. JA-3-3Ab]|nr:hypothetical protein CYA_2074 [Synechococcus sp. JA-3-3Ab]